MMHFNLNGVCLLMFELILELYMFTIFLNRTLTILEVLKSCIKSVVLISLCFYNKTQCAIVSGSLRFFMIEAMYSSEGLPF